MAAVSLFRDTNMAAVTSREKNFIDSFHDPIMQYVLGGSLHKNNTIYLPLGLYHASVNWLSIVLM